MEAPSGVFENAFEIDEAMEYPSVVIMGNLSPETLVNPDDYPNGFPFKISKTPAGRIYRLDKEGIMPSVLRNLDYTIDGIKKELKSILFGFLMMEYIP